MMVRRKMCLRNLFILLSSLIWRSVLRADAALFIGWPQMWLGLPQGWWLIIMALAFTWIGSGR
ncbi:hypothetical protein K469DRAFT_717766 [Zopfia rhizophila CBS 207.26]|uniref:Uncharacterized protein n=1 Tax=Zopfia rhizophila CBS 207.26 TaxID=1314779 RepID=A0A6A6DJZ9_9PEZI|nr:hypothetical protein K469DRAFT_717766 [Zopfia rhizophila CBS 207.26]